MKLGDLIEKLEPNMDIVECFIKILIDAESLIRANLNILLRRQAMHL